MRILLVGAGSVGQVYGLHLARGGAQVDFLIKPAHRAWASEGFTLYALNARDRAAPVRFEGYGLFDDAAATAGVAFDQIWLCTPADALSGPWLDALAAAQPGALWVNLTPGREANTRMLGLVPEERVVTGLISLISYEAPLPGETRFPGPGTAYWFPHFGPSPFVGARASEAVQALRAGGQPAVIGGGSADRQAFPTAVLMPVLLGLEAEAWSFARLRGSESLAMAVRAGQEAVRITEHQTGQRAPAPMRWVRPWMLGLVSRLATWVIPMDIETYLRVHFTKVRPQTLLFVESYLAYAARAGLPAPELRRLLSRVEPSRA